MHVSSWNLQKVRITRFIVYCVGGDLFEKYMEFAEQNMYIPEKQIVDWLSQIVEGLYALHHNHQIIHRDIKPQNIFLTKENIAKIGDFGEAFIKTSEITTATVGKCTLVYLCPERRLQRKYNYPSDIWALGITFYQLCSLCPGISVAEDALNSNFGLMPKNIYSPELTQIIFSMLNQNPTERPTALSLKGE